MFPLVEFCITNLANGAQETYDILVQDPDVEVLEYGCLSYCSECAQGLFAVVDGELVRAETAAELTKKIYAHIAENSMW